MTCLWMTPQLLLILLISPCFADTENTARSDELIREGDKEFISGKYEKAIGLYTDALNSDSSNHRAYYKRASVYLQTKSYRQALFDFNQVLAINPDFHLALQNRAKVHQELGNWEEALSDLKKLKTKKPENAAKIDVQINEVAALQSHILQGDSYFKSGSWAAAKESFTKVLDQAAGMASVRLKRAQASYRLGGYNEVLDDTMRILKADKSNAEAITIRGHAFRQLGEVEAAIQHYKSCGKLRSEACKTALQELEEFQRSRESAKSSSQNPSIARAAIIEVEKCLKYIEKEGLAIFRSDIMLTKCRAHVSLKEAEAAINVCDQAGDSAESHKLKGEAYIILEKYEDAVREYQKAVDGGDQNAHGGLQNAQRLLKMSKRKDYYKILDIPKTASPRDVKQAYRKMAMKWHPDKNPDQRDIAEVKLQDINEANVILSDPEKRGKYDRGEDLDEQHGGGGGGGGFHFQQGNPFQGFNFQFGGRRG